MCIIPFTTQFASRAIQSIRCIKACAYASLLEAWASELYESTDRDCYTEATLLLEEASKIRAFWG